MRISNIAIFTILIGLFASCAPIKDKKSFSYFNNLPKDSIYVIKDEGVTFDQKLKSGDVLSIKVSTLDAETNLLFNEGLQPGTGNSGSGGSTLQSSGYKLDRNGDIYMPLIGQLNLEFKTQEEVQAIITQKISKQVKNPIVAVRLLNAQVMVMGEVGNPGLINISDRKTTLLEAIGRAGEITPTGDKKAVLVMRTTKGNKEFAFVDMNDVAALSSPYYFLHQDDVVVVYPNKLKEKAVRGSASGAQVAQLSLGFLSTGLSIVSLILLLRK